VEVERGDKLLMGILWIFLIYAIISVLWMIAEKIIYGVLTPRILDDIVAMILAISLYFNIRYFQ
jgi:hypothetical protein